MLELRWRDVSIVLTGDIGREVEQAIAAALRAAPLRVLKVPHHGSLTSSCQTFLRRARAARRRRQRRAEQHLRPSRAGGVAPLPGHRRADLPDRPGRGGDASRPMATAVDVRTVHGTDADVRSQTCKPRRHEDTKDDTACCRITCSTLPDDLEIVDSHRPSAAASRSIVSSGPACSRACLPRAVCH